MFVYLFFNRFNLRPHLYFQEWTTGLCLVTEIEEYFYSLLSRAINFDPLLQGILPVGGCGMWDQTCSYSQSEGNWTRR